MGFVSAATSPSAGLHQSFKSWLRRRSKQGSSNRRSIITASFTVVDAGRELAARESSIVQLAFWRRGIACAPLLKQDIPWSLIPHRLANRFVERYSRRIFGDIGRASRFPEAGFDLTRLMHGEPNDNGLGEGSLNPFCS